MGILLLLRNLYLRQRNLLILIAVPVFLVDRVRVMRMSQGNSKAEGTIGRFASCGRVEVACRLEHDFFVEIELVRADTGPCLEDGGGVVVPFETPIRFIPVDGPKFNERST